MTVGIVRADLKDVGEKMKELLDLIGYAPRSDRKRVMLKPNIVDNIRPNTGVITHPKVVEALIQYYQAQGREVTIAEGSGYFAADEKFALAVKTSGYRKLADRYGVELVNLESCEREPYDFGECCAFDEYGELELPVMLKTHEYVNVPTMKTHILTLVTLGLKNQKGLLLLKDKKKFHQEGLHRVIKGLYDLVKPDLTVIDAIICLEGTGPGQFGANAREMDLLIGGTDGMEVDNIAVQVMGFSVDNVKHLTRLDNISTVGEKVEDVRAEFKPPADHIRIMNMHVYMNEEVCTSCQMVMSRMGQKIFFTPELKERLEAMGRANLVMGTARLPENLEGKTVCVGKCARETAEEYGLPLVKGCPPSHRDVIDVFFDGYYQKQEAAKEDAGTK